MFIRLKVSTLDLSGGVSELVSESYQVQNVDDDAEISINITGDAVEGGSLSVNVSVVDDDGLESISYQWQKSSDNSVWENING